MNRRAFFSTSGGHRSLSYTTLPSIPQCTHTPPYHTHTGLRRLHLPTRDQHQPILRRLPEAQLPRQCPFGQKRGRSGNWMLRQGHPPLSQRARRRVACHAFDRLSPKGLHSLYAIPGARRPDSTASTRSGGIWVLGERTCLLPLSCCSYFIAPYSGVRGTGEAVPLDQVPVFAV